MIQVEGIEFCATHRGIMTEGTDYHPDGLGCEYAEIESAERCVGWPLYVHDDANPQASTGDPS